MDCIPYFDNPMSFQSVNQDWEGLAKHDAMWAILTSPEKQGNKWGSEEFFEAGRYEISVVFELLKQLQALPVDNAMALDFGCGVGRLTQALGTIFHTVHGIDVSPTMIAKATAFNTNPGVVQFRVNSSTDIPFPPSSFSFIYTSIVLQHIPYPQQVDYIREFCRLLTPGGILAFQIPTKDIRQISLLQRIKSTLKVRERLSKIGIGTFHHMQMNAVPEAEIREVLKEAGCEVVGHRYTNHTDVGFGGRLRFMEREQSRDYESSLFIARKS